MEHPKTYLLKKIISSNEKCLKTLGQLHAKHVDDISDVILQYAEEAIIESIERLSKGEKVHVRGEVYYINKKQKKSPKR